MEISVLGDFDYIRQVIHALTRIFSNNGGESFNYASMSLLIVYTFWLYIKQVLDIEHAAYPFKEFVWGLIFWLIFASPISPKFDVKLISLQNPHRFETINDVPMMASLPAWLATNFFRTIKDITEASFTTAAYSTSSDVPDPLGALVRLYDTNMPTSLNTMGNNRGVDIRLSFRNYMNDCYLVDQALTGAEPTVPHAQLQEATISSRMIDLVKVNYNFIGTVVYLSAGGSSHGQYQSCPDAWASLKSVTQGPEFQNKMTAFLAAKGIDDKALAKASTMIYGNLTAGPTPYDIQLGTFYNYMIRDGLHKSSLETFADKMVFEGMKRRVYEKAGERNLFNQIAIPLITFLEAFSFFIVPWIMLLAVLGGVGMALIGKYMQLILFLNMWGYIKVFVDFFTAISVENAFDITNNDPFSFGDYPNTMIEIEGYLSISAAATTAIPMIAMFLLFGGVHSLMGVMKGMSAGKADSSTLAPSISGNMNNGTLSMGNQVSQFNTDTGANTMGHTTVASQHYGSMSVGNSMTTGVSSAIQTAESQVNAHQQSFTASITEAVKQETSTSTGNDYANAQKWGEQTVTQRLSSFAKSLEDSNIVGQGEGAKFAVQLAAAGHLNLAGGASSKFNVEGTSLSKSGGIGIGINGNIATDSSITKSENWQEAVKAAKAFQESLTSSESVGNDQSIVEKWSQSTNYGDSRLNQSLQNDARSISRAKSVVANASEQFGYSAKSDDSRQVLIPDAAAVINQDNSFAESLLAKLKTNDESAERLTQLGIESTSDLATLARQHDLPMDSMGMSLALTRELNSPVSSGKSETLNSNIVDNRIAADVYDFIAQKVAGPAGDSFGALANTHRYLSDSVSNVTPSSGFDNLAHENVMAQMNSSVTAGQPLPQQKSIANKVNTSNVGTVDLQANTGMYAPHSGSIQGWYEKLKSEFAENKKSTDQSFSWLPDDVASQVASVASKLFGDGQKWDAENAPRLAQEAAYAAGMKNNVVQEGTRKLLENDHDFKDDSHYDLMQQVVASNFLLGSGIYEKFGDAEKKHFAENYDSLLKRIARDEDAGKPGATSYLEMAKLIESGQVTNSAAKFFYGEDKFEDRLAQSGHAAALDYHYTNTSVFRHNNALNDSSTGSFFSYSSEEIVGQQGKETAVAAHASTAVREAIDANSAANRPSNDESININKQSYHDIYSGVGIDDTKENAGRFVQKLLDSSGPYWEFSKNFALGTMDQSNTNKFLTGENHENLMAGGIAARAEIQGVAAQMQQSEDEYTREAGRSLESRFDHFMTQAIDHDLINFGEHLGNRSQLDDSGYFKVDDNGRVTVGDKSLSLIQLPEGGGEVFYQDHQGAVHLKEVKDDLATSTHFFQYLRQKNDDENEIPAARFYHDDQGNIYKQNKNLPVALSTGGTIQQNNDGTATINPYGQYSGPATFEVPLSESSASTLPTFHNKHVFFDADVDGNSRYSADNPVTPQSHQNPAATDSSDNGKAYPFLYMHGSNSQPKGSIQSIESGSSTTDGDGSSLSATTPVSTSKLTEPAGTDSSDKGKAYPFLYTHGSNSQASGSTQPGVIGSSTTDGAGASSTTISSETPNSNQTDPAGTDSSDNGKAYPFLYMHSSGPQATEGISTKENGTARTDGDSSGSPTIAASATEEYAGGSGSPVSSKSMAIQDTSYTFTNVLDDNAQGVDKVRADETSAITDLNLPGGQVTKSAGNVLEASGQKDLTSSDQQSRPQASYPFLNVRDANSPVDEKVGADKQFARVDSVQPNVQKATSSDDEFQTDGQQGLTSSELQSRQLASHPFLYASGTYSPETEIAVASQLYAKIGEGLVQEQAIPGPASSDSENVLTSEDGKSRFTSQPEAKSLQSEVGIDSISESQFNTDLATEVLNGPLDKTSSGGIPLEPSNELDIDYSQRQGASESAAQNGAVSLINQLNDNHSIKADVGDNSAKPNLEEKGVVAGAVNGSDSVGKGLISVFPKNESPDVRSDHAESESSHVILGGGRLDTLNGVEGIGALTEPREDLLTHEPTSAQGTSNEVETATQTEKLEPEPVSLEEQVFASSASAEKSLPEGKLNVSDITQNDVFQDNIASLELDDNGKVEIDGAEYEFLGNHVVDGIVVSSVYADEGGELWTHSPGSYSMKMVYDDPRDEPV